MIKLFLNPNVSCYLRELEKEFSLSPNTLKEELDNLSGAGYLQRQRKGRKVMYQANTKHPFFGEIHSMVCKTLGITNIIDNILIKFGDIERVYILDDYAEGRDSGLIDVLVIGVVNQKKMESLCSSVEKKIQRKIRLMIVSPGEFEEQQEVYLKRPHWRAV